MMRVLVKGWVRGHFPGRDPSSLDRATVRAYNRTRNRSVRKHPLCHAPFKNMYFNIDGNVGACWLRFAGPEADPDRYPGRSIRDIWFGERYVRLREHLARGDFADKCHVCRDNLRHGNHVTVLARAYDTRSRIRRYPTMMELELDNTCNLACIMCDGNLSSTVRSTREGKPPLRSPYDDRFVEELTEFIPHLHEARFNGGEPFLGEINYQVWERMLALNPRMRIVVATNGTTVNERVRHLLHRGRFHINLSCDSLRKETYERIRVGARYETTMRNIRFYDRYCKERGTAFVILMNPMRMNWREIPDFIKFCNEIDVPVWFNTIFRPYPLALWNLEKFALKEVLEELARFDFPVTAHGGKHGRHNRQVYRNLVDQIRTWYEEPLGERKEVCGEILGYDGWEREGAEDGATQAGIGRTRASDGSSACEF